MDRTRLDRRGFLAAAGAGLAGAIAGCTEPSAGGADLASTGDGNGTDSFLSDDTGVEASSDGGVYADVYEATIDSVASLRVFGIEDPVTGEEGRGAGSGFVIDDGYLVTNDHVIAGGDEIDCQYPNGDWTSAEVVGRDFYSDLAVLSVDHVPAAAAPLSLANGQPDVGQEVLAIGNPYGLEGSASRGIVSGVNRSIQPPDREFAFPNVVQTDAAVNPGNSGGPLVDLGGTVVGVINAGWGETIGLAISAALAERVVPSLVADGEYRHPLLGITHREVDRVVANANDLPEGAGVIVVDVLDDGPAAGVLEPSDGTVRRHGEAVPVGGDVIVAVDDSPIPDQHALSSYMALEASPGDDVVVTVRRDGQMRDLEVTLEARPSRR